MLAQIGQLLNWLGSTTLPFHILDPYERGIVLRLGAYKKDLTPGWNWILPFGIDDVRVDNVVPRPLELSSQALTTADGHSIAASVALTVEIFDVKKACLRGEDVDHLTDTLTQIAVASVVLSNTWETLQGHDLGDVVIQIANPKLAPYGARIKDCGFKEMTKARVIRLLGKNDW